MKVLAAKLALVITLGAVGSGVAVPATQAGASTCTPSVFTCTSPGMSTRSTSAW